MSARHDLLTLGAPLLTQPQLVRLIARGLSDAQVWEACRALELHGDARLRALQDHPAGERLLAALELGRRAALLPSPQGRRIHGVADAALVLRPHADPTTGGIVLLALDLRLRTVRVQALAPCPPGALLRVALCAGASRVVLGVARTGPAVPRPEDVDLAIAVARAGRSVDCRLVDLLVLADDGVASLARLGLMEPGELRYR